MALALAERGAGEVERRMLRFERLISSNLLEAEVRAALSRERTPPRDDLLEPVAWILPDRPLTTEIALVLKAGYVRGADLWHLACALYAANASQLAFLTLDDRQRVVAEVLGFQT